MEILTAEGLAGIQRSDQISSGGWGGKGQMRIIQMRMIQSHRITEGVVLCLRRIFPEGRSHKCQWLQLP